MLENKQFMIFYILYF